MMKSSLAKLGLRARFKSLRSGHGSKGELSRLQDWGLTPASSAVPEFVMPLVVCQGHLQGINEFTFCCCSNVMIRVSD